MAIKKNVAKTEGIFRIILGALIIFLGLFLSHFWRWGFIALGVVFLLTAFGGY
ncbi:MAG: DUF2892 domain-containing protein [Desulfatiglans sp.]|nr:DUF2892 domain-containing protein [Desulfatiglans sp.]